MYPRSDTWLMEELRLDPIFQLLIVNSDFPPSSVSHSNSQHHHLPIFYQARNLEVLLAGLSSPLFTFCHDHILVILPVTSFTNVFLLIHSHIHSPASCPYHARLDYKSLLTGLPVSCHSPLQPTHLLDCS